MAHRDRLEILAVAIDAQGAKVVRPWVERAGATYKVVVDQENVLGQRYGLKAVPRGMLVDEAGFLFGDLGVST